MTPQLVNLPRKDTTRVLDRNLVSERMDFVWAGSQRFCLARERGDNGTERNSLQCPAVGYYPRNQRRIYLPIPETVLQTHLLVGRCEVVLSPLLP